MAVDVYNLGFVQYPQFDVLWEGNITSAGTYQLNAKVTDYQFLIVHYSYKTLMATQGCVINIGKNSNNVMTSSKGYVCIHGLQSVNAYTHYHFNASDFSKLVVDTVSSTYITLIVGVK